MSRAIVDGRLQVLADPNWPNAKRALYEAAVRLFWEKGFHPTSMQDVVEAAGLTKGAFYHYFQAKEDLLVVMLDRYMDSVIPRFKAIIESNQPADTKLSLVIAEMVESVIKHRAEVSVVLDQWRLLNEEHFSLIQRRRNQIRKLITQVVDEGIRAGVIETDLPARLVAYALIGMSYYTIYWWRGEQDVPADELASGFAKLFSGLAPLSLREGTRQAPKR